MNDFGYPKRYKDKNGRIVYSQENEFERVVLIYYGDTDRIKIKYHYFHKDLYVDVFSKSGQIIFSTVSDNVNETHVEKKPDGTLDFIISPQKLAIINSLK